MLDMQTHWKDTGTSLAPSFHLSELALARFADGKSPRGEAAQVVRHLLSRCPQCGRAVVKAAKLPW